MGRPSIVVAQHSLSSCTANAVRCERSVDLTGERCSQLTSDPADRECWGWSNVLISVTRTLV
jgi:hypothetical protein